MGDAYNEAVRLRDVHELYTVPVRVEGEGADKDVLPLGPWGSYTNGDDEEAAFVEIWNENTEAPGLALMCGSRFGVVALDADTPDAERLVLERKVPRTPAWRSTRGPHWLFRCTDALTSGAIAPGLDLLGEKKLALIPPTRDRSWLPSQSVDDVPMAMLPDWVRAAAKAKRARKPATVTAGADIPPGEAHDRMVSMIGKLGRVLSRSELEVVAVRLNESRLPADELARIVEHVLEKEGDAGRYFEKGEFIVPRLGNEIAEAFDIRVGAGRHLYWYRNGVFRDTGREQIERAARRALGERYKRRHAEELAAWFRAEQQQIPDDPDPAFLNVANGMLDWRTGELHAHSPERLSIIQSPVAWNPDAACPGVDEFLVQVLPADAQRLARELFGYALWPSARMRRAVMLLGSGSNGKSTWLALERALLGRRNVSAVPLQVFGESRFATADVYGKLANLCGDLDARALRHSDTFKTLTGGTDAVRAERKYESAFYFVPFATMVFSANEPPASSDQSDAYFDRWIVLPFEQRFEEGAGADPFLIDKLTTRAELEGLLVQAVSGLMDLAERGYFDLPPSVVAANAEYRAKIDTVATFLDEACRLDVKASVARARLYERYRQWCGDNGRMPIGQQSFAPRVRHELRHEIAAGKVEESTSASAGRPWKGLALRVA